MFIQKPFLSAWRHTWAISQTAQVMWHPLDLQFIGQEGVATQTERGWEYRPVHPFPRKAALPLTPQPAGFSRGWPGDSMTSTTKVDRMASITQVGQMISKTQGDQLTRITHVDEMTRTTQVVQMTSTKHVDRMTSLTQRGGGAPGDHRPVRVLGRAEVAPAVRAGDAAPPWLRGPGPRTLVSPPRALLAGPESHYTLHTPHSTLHTPHSTLHTTHYTLHTTHWAPNTRQPASSASFRSRE